MKSPMIERAGYISSKEKRYYTEMKVLKSNAGYYVGTLFMNPHVGFKEPGSRDSCYFNTKEEADELLEQLEEGNEDAIMLLRDSP